MSCFILFRYNQYFSKLKKTTKVIQSEQSYNPQQGTQSTSSSLFKKKTSEYRAETLAGFNSFNISKKVRALKNGADACDWRESNTI